MGDDALTVGLIGVGRMGTEVGVRLLDAGLRLLVHDRVHAAAVQLERRGAAVVDRPRDLGRRCRIVISLVTDGPAVMDVVSGEDGLLRAARPGLLLVDMTTIGVDESERVAETCESAGVRYVRCPVLGSVAAARAGGLIALMSGTQQAVDEVGAVVSHVAGARHYLGGGEQARVVKLVANSLMASSLLSLLEGAVLAERAGVTRDALLGVLASSNMASPFLKGAAHRLRDGDFAPNLTIELLLKDLRLLGQTAAAAGVVMPMGTVAAQLYQTAANKGLGELDPIAVAEVIEWLSGPAAHP